jgi:Na+/proline symporter
MQKLLSSKSPREAALMSMFVNVVLLPTRYFMIIGFTVLGLLFFKELNIQTATGSLDFERILPAAIVKFAPAGLLGLFLVELMAAFMGTFAGTLNAAQAYIVNDIYLKDIKPKASNKEIKHINYLVGIIVVLISIVLGIFDDLAEVCYQMNYRTYNYETKEFDIDNLQEHTRKVDYMRLIKI